MKTLKKNAANLVKVKTIVTLMVLAVFVILALRGDITPDNVMVIVSSVVSFYFGTQHEKQVREPEQVVYVGETEGVKEGATVNGFAGPDVKE